MELAYLRRLEDGTPAAGHFEGWPNSLKDFTLLDPCCGSGHFLVAAFLLLVPMRMASEGLSAKEAVDSVLAENLHGLELDARCVEIAVFALAMAAWRFPSENGKPLGVRKAMPSPKVACCGLKLSSTTEQWQALVPADAPDTERLRAGLAELHRAFSQAPLLGSLLHPARAGEANLLAAGSEELADFLSQALSEEQPLGSGNDADQAVEMVMTARGLLDTARLLDGRYHLVATNVPYLARGKQSETLKKLSESHYQDAKNDLANAFLERCLELSRKHGEGVVQIVMPQNWLFLISYKNQRESLLKRVQWNLLARLGEGGFASPQAAGAFIILLTQTNTPPAVEFQLQGVDASEPKVPHEKADLLRKGDLVAASQKGQLRNPDAVISLTKLSDMSPLSDFAESVHGLAPGDTARATRCFWECPAREPWHIMCSTPSGRGMVSGKCSLILSPDALEGAGIPGFRYDGRKAWGRKGVYLGKMRDLPASLYFGEIFDDNGHALVPRNKENLPAIAAFAFSEEFSARVREINQKNAVTTSAIVKIPFDFDYWQEIASEKYQKGLPKPYSDDTSQWLFHGHPRSATEPLQVAVARLVGYRWPAETDASMELSEDAHEWIARCEALASHADDDGIVCLPSVRGEPAAHERLGKLLGSAFGDDWSSAKEREILLAAAIANNTRKPEASLAAWLRDSFFSEHCKLFQSRPFVWQVWDGNPTGFSALVNIHKLTAPHGQGRKTLELLTFTYLGDWIDRQRLDQADGVNGADDRLTAALDLQGLLKKILEGEPPYDIFVRWKPLHSQAIGWDPDINDGVRLNIRPFLIAELRKNGKTGAGILRTKPGNIKWGKDRGKDASRSKDDFPWFWGWDENSPAMATDFGAPVSGAPPAGDSFDGNRWNDLHYTRAAKEAARARHRGEG